MALYPILQIIKILYLTLHLTLFIKSILKYGIAKTIPTWIYLFFMILWQLEPFLLIFITYDIYIKLKYPDNIIYAVIFLYIGYKIKNPFRMFQPYTLKLLGLRNCEEGYFTVTDENTMLDAQDLKNSSLFVEPHGPTILPFAFLCELIYKRTNIISKVLIGKTLNNVPYVNWLSSLITDLCSATPNEINKLMQSDNKNLILIYPGGTKDLLDNSYYNSNKLIVNLQGLQRLFDYHIKYRRKIIPVLCLNENDNFFQPGILILLFRFINKFIRFGMPTLFWSKYGLFLPTDTPIKLIFGSPIIPSESDTFVSLKSKYITALCDLISLAHNNGWSNKSLVIKT